MPSIKAESVCFSYGDAPILKDIDLEFDGPGLYCIIGPNGVGKSTLIKCMNGLLEPTSGRVMVNGRDVSECSVKELSKEISYVPAATSIGFPMSVVDSILLAQDSRTKWRLDDEDIALAYRSLRVMNMDELALRGCNELSAGQMQKASICRGLVRQSDIMILDEPTSNLDIRHQIFISDFLQKLARKSGQLIVMISHDLNIAARFADSVVVMSHPGVIHSFGPPSDVINERMIREVYLVRSEVIDHNGRPHIILESAESW